MAKYHDIASDIWEDLIQLKTSEKLVYIFLFSNPLCRPSGLYKIRPITIKTYTGVSEGAWRGPLGGLIEYDETTSEIWVRGKLKHFRKLSDNWPLRKSVERDLQGLSSKFLKELFLKKYGEILEEVLRGPVGPIGQGQGQSPFEKKKGCGEKEKQNFNFDGLTKQQRHVLKQLEEMRNARRPDADGVIGPDSSFPGLIVQRPAV